MPFCVRLWCRALARRAPGGTGWRQGRPADATTPAKVLFFVQRHRVRMGCCGGRGSRCPFMCTQRRAAWSGRRPGRSWTRRRAPSGRQPAKVLFFVQHRHRGRSAVVSKARSQHTKRHLDLDWALHTTRSSGHLAGCGRALRRVGGSQYRQNACMRPWTPPQGLLDGFLGSLLSRLQCDYRPVGMTLEIPDQPQPERDHAEPTADIRGFDVFQPPSLTASPLNN